MPGGGAPEEVAPGLWRWTAPHPAWHAGAELDSPGDWDEDVGCVLLIDGTGDAVFVDPLLPADEDAFWHWCDGAVGSRAVYVLTTIRFHGRSREAVAGRYGGTVVTRLDSLPPAVEAFQFRDADETMFWLPGHGALVPGDRLIGGRHGEGVRLCPDPWLGYLAEHQDALQLASPAHTQAELRVLLRPLLRLPVQSILVSHGAPMRSGGEAALRQLLA